MRILILHPQFSLYGGAEVVIVRLANYLQDHGHTVSIATLCVGKHSEYASLNFIEGRHIEYRIRSGFTSLAELYRICIELKRLVGENARNFDVINPHNFPSVWSTQKGAVWVCNEIPDWWHNSIMLSPTNILLNATRFVDRKIVQSKHPIAVVADSKMAQLFEHRYQFKPEVIPYGIDGKFFSQVMHKYNDFTILQPSMISPSKMQLETLKAIKELKVRAVFAGYREKNGYTDALDEYISQNNVNATFTGHVNKEMLRELYCKTSVAVFPGRGQGSWLGPFEALAAEVPVIVSPKLSCSELIEKRDIGVVSDDLESAIAEVRDNYSKYKEQALRGKELVLAELTWDKYCEGMLKVFEETAS